MRVDLRLSTQHKDDDDDDDDVFSENLLHTEGDLQGGAGKI